MCVVQAFIKTAENIYEKIKEGVYDPSREGNGVKLTEDEKAMLRKLRDLTEMHAKLPAQHRSEPAEWAMAMHRLQDLVASRPGYREVAAETEVGQRKNGGT